MRMIELAGALGMLYAAMQSVEVPDGTSYGAMDADSTLSQWLMDLYAENPSAFEAMLKKAASASGGGGKFMAKNTDEFEVFVPLKPLRISRELAKNSQYYQQAKRQAELQGRALEIEPEPPPPAPPALDEKALARNSRVVGDVLQVLTQFGQTADRLAIQQYAAAKGHRRVAYVVRFDGAGLPAVVIDRVSARDAQKYAAAKEAAAKAGRELRIENDSLSNRDIEALGERRDGAFIVNLAELGPGEVEQVRVWCAGRNLALRSPEQS